MKQEEARTNYAKIKVPKYMFYAKYGKGRKTAVII